MTFKELEINLPNGFHDSKIGSIAIDYEKRLARIHMAIWVAVEEDNPEIYRSAILTVSDLVFLAADLPSPRALDGLPYRAQAEAISVDGVAATDETFPALQKLRPKLPANSQIFSFYVESWNSFLHICAGDVQFHWDGKPRPLSKPR